MANQKTFNLIIVIIFIFIFGVFIYSSVNRSDYYEEGINNLNIKSVVSRKFTAVDNHNIQYIIYNNDSVIISNNWDKYIDVGDSIIKPEGSTIFVVKNINKYIEFDYTNPGQLPPR